MRILIFCLLLIFARPSHAEIFQNITPFQTLGEVKRQFPNAKFESIKAAWVKDEDGFYKMTGAGFSGTLFLAFGDARPTFRKFMQDEGAHIEQLEATDSSEVRDRTLNLMRSRLKTYQESAEESDDNALTISWLRWVPASAIPLQRYISKYGAPDKSGFNDDDMSPYRSWKKLGVRLTLTDDEKNVLSAEFEFTPTENLTYCRRQYPPNAHKFYCQRYADQVSKRSLKK